MTDPLFQVDPSRALYSGSLGNSDISRKAVRSRVDLGDLRMPANFLINLN